MSQSTRARRALIVGHFSTVGDVECVEAVKAWCARADLAVDVAPYSRSLQKQIGGALNPASAQPTNYSHLFVVCGPCYPALFAKNQFRIERYAHCFKVGVNLTMVAPLKKWNPFDLLLERDSDCATRADLAFTSRIEIGPVAGRCIVARQREYGDRQRHALSLTLIDDLIRRRALPSIEIATDWPNAAGLIAPNSANVVSSIISRVDVLITNRLHGMVLALRNGVPALAIDAVAGGDKLTAQARVLNWPACLQADRATPQELDEALAWCLTPEARELAAATRDAAMKAAVLIGEEVVAALAS